MKMIEILGFIKELVTDEEKKKKFNEVITDVKDLIKEIKDVLVVVKEFVSDIKDIFAFFKKEQA